MDERLGSLARFGAVAGVRQVNHLVVDMSWCTVDDTLPLAVQYDAYHRPIIRFSPYAGADEVALPREYVTLTGEEFLSVLVWLVRQGLLEDVGLVSTETAEDGRGGASPLQDRGLDPRFHGGDGRGEEDDGPHQCLCAVEPAPTEPADDEETERIQSIAEWGIEQEMARRESQAHAEQGRGQRLVTMVADEASVDDVGARHASPLQEEEGEPESEDPFDGEYDLVEGSGDPSWLELSTVMRHLHHELELSVTDIARLCETTYARVKSALHRLGIEIVSYRGGRSKIGSRRDAE